MSLCFAYASENSRFIFIPPGKRGTFWKGKILSFKEDLVRNANIIFLFGCTVGEITNIWDTHQAIILNFLQNTASTCQGICLEIVEILRILWTFWSRASWKCPNTTYITRISIQRVLKLPKYCVCYDLFIQRVFGIEHISNIFRVLEIPLKSLIVDTIEHRSCTR